MGWIGSRRGPRRPWVWAEVGLRPRCFTGPPHSRGRRGWAHAVALLRALTSLCAWLPSDAAALSVEWRGSVRGGARGGLGFGLKSACGRGVSLGPRIRGGDGVGATGLGRRGWARAVGLLRPLASLCAWLPSDALADALRLSALRIRLTPLLDRSPRGQPVLSQSPRAKPVPFSSIANAFQHCLAATARWRLLLRMTPYDCEGAGHCARRVDKRSASTVSSSITLKANALMAGSAEAPMVCAPGLAPRSGPTRATLAPVAHATRPFAAIASFPIAAPSQALTRSRCGRPGWGPARRAGG